MKQERQILSYSETLPLGLARDYLTTQINTLRECYTVTCLKNGDEVQDVSKLYKVAREYAINKVAGSGEEITFPTKEGNALYEELTHLYGQALKLNKRYQVEHLSMESGILATLVTAIEKRRGELELELN